MDNLIRTKGSSTNHCDGGITSYDLKVIGDNVLKYFQEMKDQSVKIDLKDINGGYLFILCSVQEEHIIRDESITVIPDDYKEEDYIVLFFGLSSILPVENKQRIWDNVLDIINLKKHKQSTVKENEPEHHYGSQGECYSFGVRNGFSMDTTGLYSYTWYANDSCDEMQQYKHFIWNSLRNVYEAFNRIVMGISTKLFEVGKSMEYISDNHKMPSIVTGNQTGYTSLAASINIDATTSLIHCERDVSYTIIHVPEQKNGAYINFEFQLNNKYSLLFRSDQNTAFAYSSYCLAHRQVSTYGHKCMNVSSYVGKRLYESFRMSLWRGKKDDDEKKKKSNGINNEQLFSYGNCHLSVGSAHHLHDSR